MYCIKVDQLFRNNNEITLTKLTTQMSKIYITNIYNTAQTFIIHEKGISTVCTYVFVILYIYILVYNLYQLGCSHGVWVFYKLFFQSISIGKIVGNKLRDFLHKSATL